MHGAPVAGRHLSRHVLLALHPDCRAQAAALQHVSGEDGLSRLQGQVQYARRIVTDGPYAYDDVY